MAKLLLRFSKFEDCSRWYDLNDFLCRSLTQLLAASSIRLRNLRIPPPTATPTVLVGYIVVKISDQVLGTYLFYRAFFKVESADFSVLLSDYFGDYEYKFREAIYPILGTFNHQFISERLQKHIDANWIAAGGGVEAKLLPIMRVFWFLKKEETKTVADQLG